MEEDSSEEDIEPEQDGIQDGEDAGLILDQADDDEDDEDSEAEMEQDEIEEEDEQED